MQVLEAIGVSACVVLVGIDRALRSCPSVFVSTFALTNFTIIELILEIVNAVNDIWIAEILPVLLSHAVHALLLLIALVVGCGVPLLCVRVPALIAVPLHDTTIRIEAHVDIFAALTYWNLTVIHPNSTITDFTFILIEEFLSIFTNANWLRFFACIFWSYEHRRIESGAYLAIDAHLAFDVAEVDLLGFCVRAGGSGVSNAIGVRALLELIKAFLREHRYLIGAIEASLAVFQSGVWIFVLVPAYDEIVGYLGTFVDVLERSTISIVARIVVAGTVRAPCDAV